MARQAQAAMEFITTYGWALVVILLALGALTYFGVLDTVIRSPDSCELWPEFSCQESQVTNEGLVRLMIRNNLPDLEFVNVTLDTGSCELLENSYSQGVTRNTAVLNSSLITFRCMQPLTQGAIFEADIIVQYRGPDQVILQQTRGLLRRAVE